MTADVVIVGGGVIGASCAVHLARAGMRVTVLDRGPAPGSGSTARATGGFRASYATAINVRLSLLARAALERFHDDTGVDPGFVPVGYLWLAGRDAELAALRDAHALQRSLGATDTFLFTADELPAIAPHVGRRGVIGGAWCPRDGVMRPTEILRGYLALAERLGVVVRWGEDVRALVRRGDGPILAVETSHATYPAAIVVDAAGPWAAQIARLAHLDVPVTPLRRQVAVTAPTDALPGSTPLTIWVGDGFHLRVRDGRVLLLHPSPGVDGDPWSTRVDDAWQDGVAARAAARVPALAHVPLDRARAWAGLYEMSPDHHALLGWAPGCTNLMLVAGNSGHGVMHAPALGLLAAEIARDGEAKTIDAHALRPSRFAEHDPVRGSSLL